MDSEDNLDEPFISEEQQKKIDDNIRSKNVDLIKSKMSK